MGLPATPEADHALKRSCAWHELVPGWRVDEDFVVVGAFASETDHLDVGSQRGGWNAEALAIQDGEVSGFETSAAPDVLRACRSIVARFRE